MTQLTTSSLSTPSIQQQLHSETTVCILHLNFLWDRLKFSLNWNHTRLSIWRNVFLKVTIQEIRNRNTIKEVNLQRIGQVV